MKIKLVFLTICAALAAPATPEADAIAARKLRQAPAPIAETEFRRLKHNFPPPIKTSWQNKFEYTAPDTPVWVDLRGYIITATLESIPASLARLDARVAAEREAALKVIATSKRVSSRSEKAHLTLRWINEDLTPYLARMRALRL